MTLYSIFKAVALSRCPNYRKRVVKWVNSKLRPKRTLPFILYFSEDSTKDKLIFRVVHRTGGTANRIVVTKETIADRWGREKTIMKIDASDGSNWHHLRFEFVQWLRSVLIADVPEHLTTLYVWTLKRH